LPEDAKRPGNMPKGRKKGRGVRPLTRVRTGRLEEKKRNERKAIMKWVAIIFVLLMVVSAFFVMKM